MKTFFLQSAALALCAGIALSANAKPNETQAVPVIQAGDRSNTSIQVAAGTATTAVSGRRDRPISPARRRP